MTKTNATGLFRPRNIIAIGIAGLLTGFAAIYVIGAPAGNGGTQLACSAGEKSRAAVKTLATGEVAAFLPASKPVNVTELSFKDGDGKQITMADFKGRTILLNLWATWCAPCRHEMPALNALQKEMGDDSFEVVAVNIDKGETGKPQAFLDEVSATDLRYWADPSMKILAALRKKGRATGLPTTMLIDGEGCEIGVLYGPAEWASDDAKSLIKAAMTGSEA
ncbi:MAG: redoxin family protein [Stappiaceae bacterium]